MAGHARYFVVGVICLAGVFGVAGAAEAQLGALLSPGRLARPHAELEGVANCFQCHERGQRVTPEKCLACHKPVADRILARRGVHKDAGRDCVSCHVDHAGVDGELRPFATAGFDHAGVAGFPLNDRHAPVAARCDACHKGRSFLAAKPACSTCHADPHKGSLGTTCETCHSARVDFRNARTAFDHTTTAFPLTGAHRSAACSTCHTDTSFRTARARATTCASCHQTPHPRSMSASCTTCHTTASWRTRRFDHAATAFPLAGRHATVDCIKCHVQPATKVKPPASTCATCHTDPHKREFKQDCAACHNERGFAGATFDHAATRFPLADRHAGLTCRQCHTGVSPANVPLSRKVADFRGLGAACATCHVDPHQPALGSACEACHSARTFRMASFVHPKSPEFFAGRHSALACQACHVPAAPAARPGGAAAPALATARFRDLPTACASCHVDVHLGQVGPACETCHSVAAEDFAPDRFGHERTRFRLEGRHAAVACAACHRRETGAFPAGSGSAVRLSNVGSACASCHVDTHLGQVGTACATCHGQTSFSVAAYTHKTPPRGFFVGRHLAAPCAACHKPVTGAFPAGTGTAVRFDIPADCVSCHTDVHNGSLGRNCIACHKPEPLRPSHALLAGAQTGRTDR